MQTFVFNDLLARATDKPFDDTELAAALKRLPAPSVNGPWLAGGALRRTIMGAVLDSDFDFFFRDPPQYERFKEDLTGRGALHVSSNEHASTWKLPHIPARGDKEGDRNIASQPELLIQAIRIANYADAAAVIDTFDFTICQFVFDGERVHCGDLALWDLARRRLVPTKITYGVASVRRIIKYTRQGFTICSGGIADILSQVVADPHIIHAETAYVD